DRNRVFECTLLIRRLRADIGGLAHLCATNHEAAPPFAVFERWAPETSTLRSFGDSQLRGFHGSAEFQAAAILPGTIVRVPTLRKPRSVGQPKVVMIPA